MAELLTAAQMRAIEQAAIDAGEVTGLELMERAGRGVVEAIFEEWPELAAEPHRVVVLCGPGNNGGDGFVVARLLKEWGWEVEVFLFGDAERLPGDARANYDRWLALGAVGAWSDLTVASYGKRGTLVVDALFGIGLSRGLPDDIRNVLMGTLHQKRVAIDIPSGLSSENGSIAMQWNGMHMASLTVTFHALKRGHILGEGPSVCGHVRCVEIGLRPRVGVANPVRLVEPVGVAKSSGCHKYDHGHVLALSGGPAATGAARLAARGALRVGAGLVTLGVPSSALAECASQLTAIMLSAVDDAEALSERLGDSRITALCIGPGLGRDRRAAGLARAALSSMRSMVVDADALTLMGADVPLFAALHDRCVLTPHGGEFSRLFPDLSDKLKSATVGGAAYSKVDAVQEAAARAGCVVLFKGPDTVIAAPDGRCAINASVYERAVPWLATAGTGDVLAGFVAGLLARGFSPFDAACTGAWLHTECALSFGPGLIAEDLPEELPKVFRALGL